MTETSPVAISRSDSPERPAFRSNALLAGITDEVYDALADKISVIRCSPNEIIFEENDPGDSLFLIAEGSVKISKRGRAGQQETLAYLMEGDFFGEMALLTGEMRTADVVAATDVVALEIGKESLQPILGDHPDLAGAISHQIMLRREHLEALRGKSPEEEELTLISRIRNYFGLL